MRFLIDSVLFKNVVRIMRTMADEVEVKFTENTMSITAVERSHVMLANVTMDCESELIDQYDPQGMDSCAWDLERIERILKMIKGRRLVEVWSEGQPPLWNTLCMNFDSVTRRMPMVDPSSLRNEVRIPNINFTAQADLYSQRLAYAVECGKDIPSDGVEFAIRNDGFEVVTANDSEKAVFRMEQLEAISELCGNAHAFYPNREVRKIVKALPKDVPVTIRMDDDNYPMPVKMEFAGDGFEGYYLVAPRIDMEDRGCRAP